MNTTDVESNIHQLQWPDYLVISLIMTISIVIGFYYRFTGGRQSTAQEYFAADNSIGILPLGLAMMAAHISAITVLGVSGEVVIYGFRMMFIFLGILLATPLMLFYLPVFFEMNVISIYEYLEERFGLNTRLLVSATNFTETILMTGVTLYAPSLALEATTGLSSIMSILILTIICTIYSTLGGIKAVLITDIFQGLLMFLSVIIIIITVSMDIGGLDSIWHIAQEGNRFDMSSWNFDITDSNSNFSLFIGGCGLVGSIAVNQVQIQRLLSVKDIKVASKAALVAGPFIFLIGFLTCCCGLAIYTFYSKCDPVATGKITTYDKILPYYIVDTLPPGVVGLIVSGILSASLSTTSAMMNSLAAVALEDYVKPLHRKFGVDFSDRKALFTAKALTILNGVLCLLLALLAKTMGSLISIAFSVHGSIGGPILGIYSLGMFTENANEVGTIIGMLTGLTVCMWSVFGYPKPPRSQLPISVEECANSTLLMLAEQTHNSTVESDPSSYFFLYKISFLWYNPIGFIITVVVGYTASCILRLIQRRNNIERDPKLFVPCLAARIRRRRQDAQKTTSSQVFVLEPR